MTFVLSQADSFHTDSDSKKLLQLLTPSTDVNYVLNLLEKMMALESGIAIPSAKMQTSGVFIVQTHLNKGTSEIFNRIEEECIEIVTR